MASKIEEVYNYWVDSSVSENTKKSYRRVVPQFLNMMFGKELKDVNRDDILSLVPLSVAKKYKEPLGLNGNKNSTIIQNMSVISSFFKQLEINRVFEDVNYQWIKEACLSTKRIKNDKEHRGNMSKNDYENLKTWLSQYDFSARYADKKEKYPLLLEFMWNTASRISAVFNLKWSDIKYEEDGVGNYGYVAYIHDKGSKTNKKVLTNEFYNRLKDCLFESMEDNVFKDLSQVGFTKLIKEFCEIAEKDFTPHSIKRGSVTFLYSLTHDLVLTQRFADHDDPKTTIGYIQSEPDRTKQGSYIISKKFDFGKLNELSKEDLLSIIQDNSDLQYRVLMEAENRFLIEGE